MLVWALLTSAQSVWDRSHLNEVKGQLQQPAYATAYQTLMDQADALLGMTPPSVMMKDKVAASGDKHDYLSLSRYFWPDTSKPDGLPYINRDGQSNPELERLDRNRLSEMADGVTTLSLAWFFSGDERYARKATQLLRTWFLDKATRMNPHLEYAQMVPGQNGGRGRCYGLIDAYSFVEMLDGVLLLESSKAFTSADGRQLRQWFSQFLQWMLTSPQGQEESRQANNHAIAYDVQLLAYARFVGNEQVVGDVLSQFAERRLQKQIEADGRQPHELSRTLAFGYSEYNLSHIIDVFQLARHAGFQQQGMPLVQRAADFLAQYLGRDVSAWPYQQISQWEEKQTELRKDLYRLALLNDSPSADEPGLLPSDRFRLLYQRPSVAGEGRHVLVLAERGGQHEGFTAAALRWLREHSRELGISLTVVSDAQTLRRGDIFGYQLVLQLNYPPYAWSREAMADFERYIDEGRGGFVGFHHATLLGEFDGWPLWQWFSRFMGGIRFQTYIPQLADGTVEVERRDHPVMAGLPPTFVIPRDEWYTYDRSPRPNVEVLARVNEDSYIDRDEAPEGGPAAFRPMPTMGDHPVVWTNPSKKARNVYFQFGHHAQLLQTPAFTRLLTNAIRWALHDDYPANYASKPRFNALVCYDPHAEEAHVQFDRQFLQFFHKLSYGEGFRYKTVTTMDGLTLDSLRQYSIVIWLNFQPGGEARQVFQQYMEQGGGWMGFHASAYNDRNTHWPWLNEFLGCGPFLCNNWPPQPALVCCDSADHPVTRSLPQQYVCPASEFYQWSPSPRDNADVEVLLSLSPKNYPFGLKDVVRYGDFPVVWTNKRFRMVYLNMGHGDESFIDATQNLLFVNAFRWVVSRDPQGDPFKE